MIGTRRAADRVSYRLSCQLLRGVLRELVAAGAIGSVACRTAAALYALLLEHPIDQRGRCWSCGRAAAVVLGRRRRCRIYRVVHFWLHQPRTAPLISALTDELGLSLPPPPVPTPDRPRLRITDRFAPDERDGTETVDDPPTAPGPSALGIPVLGVPVLITGSARCPA